VRMRKGCRYVVVQVTVPVAPVELLTLALKPNVAVALGTNAPFQLSSVTVYELAAWLVRPPQSWVMVALSDRTRFTCQPPIRLVLVLVTTTSPRKAPAHALTMR